MALLSVVFLNLNDLMSRPCLNGSDGVQRYGFAGGNVLVRGMSGQISRPDAHGSASVVLFLLVVVLVIDDDGTASLEFCLSWASESDSFVFLAIRPGSFHSGRALLCERQVFLGLGIRLLSFVADNRCIALVLSDSFPLSS